jgi:hypothetical protein
MLELDHSLSVSLVFELVPSPAASVVRVGSILVTSKNKTRPKNFKQQHGHIKDRLDKQH